MSRKGKRGEEEEKGGHQKCVPYVYLWKKDLCLPRTTPAHHHTNKRNQRGDGGWILLGQARFCPQCLLRQLSPCLFHPAVTPWRWLDDRQGFVQAGLMKRWDSAVVLHQRKERRLWTCFEHFDKQPCSGPGRDTFGHSSKQFCDHVLSNKTESSRMSIQCG